MANISLETPCPAKPYLAGPTCMWEYLTSPTCRFASAMDFWKIFHILGLPLSWATQDAYFYGRGKQQCQHWCQSFAKPFFHGGSWGKGFAHPGNVPPAPPFAGPGICRDTIGHPMPGESNAIHITAVPRAGGTLVKRSRAVISTSVSSSLYK